MKEYVIPDHVQLLTQAASEIMPCWYYDKKQLRDTPSIRDGITLEIERRYRKEGARFIMSCGTQMGLGHNTMATGVVYFHRFYMFHSFKSFPRYVTACCCLFLAGKVEETPKKCRDIIRAARGLLNDKYFYSFGDDPKEEVMTLERILLQTIKFDLQVDHPYQFLLKYAKCLKGDQQKLQKMVQMAWNFVNDSLSTVVCLQWEPEIIAVALIHLASKLSKFSVTDWTGRTTHTLRWWDMFVSEVTMEILEDICHQVLDLYQSNQTEPPESHSPPQKPPSQIDTPPPPPPQQQPRKVYQRTAEDFTTPSKKAKFLMPPPPARPVQQVHVYASTSSAASKNSGLSKSSAVGKSIVASKSSTAIKSSSSLSKSSAMSKSNVVSKSSAVIKDVLNIQPIKSIGTTSTYVGSSVGSSSTGPTSTYTSYAQMYSHPPPPVPPQHVHPLYGTPAPPAPPSFIPSRSSTGHVPPPPVAPSNPPSGLVPPPMPPPPLRYGAPPPNWGHYSSGPPPQSSHAHQGPSTSHGHQGLSTSHGHQAPSTSHVHPGLGISHAQQGPGTSSSSYHYQQQQQHRSSYGRHQHHNRY